MIDERINNNTGIENEEQEIDLVALLFKYLFYWRWFVASILICCIATYLFLRYQTPVYNISSSVLIKEEDKRSGSGNNPLAAIQDLGMFSMTNNFDNEVEILKSRTLIKKVVNDLNLYVRVAEKRAFGYAMPLYKNSPVRIYMTPEEAENIARIVGLGSLKYFILKVDARKNMTFNPKESIDFNGNTVPFIQYTYARIQSVLRKAAESGIVIPEQIPAGIELSEKEEGLIQMLADFKTVVKQAGTDYNPSIIANYTYDLVKEYNQFYHDFSILREEDEALKIFRLALSANVGKIVKSAMGLLGIEVPERM